MKKESIIYGGIGILAGILIAGFGAAYAVNGDHQGMMKMIGIHTNTVADNKMNASNMSMSDMTTSLKSKTGDDFDKAFISDMIIHHQSAIDMANLAQKNAKHDEIKNLANDIVTAQTREITEMKSWQTLWGYSPSSSNDNGHDMNNMMGH